MQIVSVSLARTFGLCLLSLLAVGLLCHGAQSASLRVPEDGSLPLERYASKGVPRPDHIWEDREYFRALVALEDLPRAKLPRVGSRHSEALFERLLVTYTRIFGDITRKDSKGQLGEANTGLTLPDLYEPNDQDDLLFDRELVAVKMASLRGSLRRLPSWRDLEKQQQLLTKSGGGAQNKYLDGIREDLWNAEAMREHSARILKHQAADAIALMALSELRLQARRDFVEEAEELFLRLPRFLQGEELRGISKLLEGVANSPVNEPVRDRLLELASSIPTERKHSEAGRR